MRKENPENLAVAYHQLLEVDNEKKGKQRKKLLEEAKENILHAQQKQKDHYDRKYAKPHLFEKGQLVLKKDFTRRKRKGGKLDPRFSGPFTII